MNTIEVIYYIVIGNARAKFLNAMRGVERDRNCKLIKETKAAILYLFYIWQIFYYHDYIKFYIIYEQKYEFTNDHNQLIVQL